MKKIAIYMKKFKKCLHSRQKCAIIQWFGKPNETPYAPLAQMDRAQASDAWCRRFESAMVRQQNGTPLAGVPFCSCILVSTKKRTQKISFSADEARIGSENLSDHFPRAEVRFSGRHGASEKSTAFAALFSIQAAGLVSHHNAVVDIISPSGCISSRVSVHFPAA